MHEKENEMSLALQAFITGDRVEYRFPKTEWIHVLDGHRWSMDNEYKVVKPREFTLEKMFDGTIKVVESEGIMLCGETIYLIEKTT